LTGIIQKIAAGHVDILFPAALRPMGFCLKIQALLL